MQTKRAVRPSTTSTSSSLRVKSGCTEGCTVSRALQVSSSARRVGTGECPQHMPVQGRRQPVTHPPAAIQQPVWVSIPHSWWGLSPGLWGSGLCPVQVSGVQMCVRSPRPGLGL